MADLREAGLAPALSRPKLAELLAEKHPDMKWERLFLLRGRFAQQRRLERAMSALFPVPPGCRFSLETYHILEWSSHHQRAKGSGITWRNGRVSWVGYLPPQPQVGLRVSGEFVCLLLCAKILIMQPQERHHYISAQYTYRPLEEIQSRDAVKVTLAASKGITLITVPCWWDGAVERYV